MDLLFVVVLSIILLPVALVTSGALRVVLGVAFVLFFPGYTLIAALFPAKRGLSRTERLALSFGLSIAVVPLIGLGLNYTPWGIRLTPILISVLLFILIMSAIAWYRRRRLPPEDRFGINLRFSLASLSHYWISQRPLDKVLGVILVVAIAAALGTLGYVVATPKVGEKYTEFYILGANGKAGDYPTQVTLGQEWRVTLGIVNHEQGSTTYRAEIDVGGKKVQDISSFSLNDGEKWEQAVTFKPGSAGPSQEVEFLLYKGADNTPADSLHIWIDVKP